MLCRLWIGNVGWSLRLMYFSAARWSAEMLAESMTASNFLIPKHVVKVVVSPGVVVVSGHHSKSRPWVPGLRCICAVGILILSEEHHVVGIFGAGAAGLNAAYLLTQAGTKVIVFEAGPHCVGGISRTVVYKGYRFDIGGHRFFSKTQEVEGLWGEILPDDFLICERISRIYYKGKLYSYPVDAAEVIDNFGKRQAALTLASCLKGASKNQQDT